jgi:hypothetical protein
MGRFTIILATGALLAGAASADASKGKGGGTPPYYGTCTSTDATTTGFTGYCTSTNPAGRQCTQWYVNGQGTEYSCVKT